MTAGAAKPDDLPQRSHLRRLTRVWSKHPVYFITCCTHERRRMLADESVAQILVAAWHDAPHLSGWTVGRYVIMPDHVHFFATAHAEAKTLGAWIRDWKRWTARGIVAARPPLAAPIWQPEFFDHLLRSADSYSAKWDYVRLNPVRAGLVGASEAWPYSGECTPLEF